MFSKFLNLFSLVLFVTVEGTNYCSKSLCSRGQHIGCHNSGDWSNNCPSDARIIDLSEYKDLIVREHNKRRNEVAGGKIRHLQSATHMASMEWDDELAKLAEMNVRQCVMRHDSCRNTEKYKFSGQNLAYGASSGKYGPIDQALKDHIESWWSENIFTKQSDIKRYPLNNKQIIGHFTVMAVDNNVAVGCGAARYTENGWDTFLLACNYAATNLINEKIYKPGPAGSECQTGRNSEYKNLCSIKEKY